ncbi:LysM peptidoglycan-binding domain-containing protein [Aspergillus mulundensis]|uniref:LysM domain-containing protein n=1 Tax=Aspergillus mulundensis TaxID=1810919 RepID=A0A3D8SUK2_9EURO|nr:hypothetical protein DSM5745_01778 [Aspergillus mulundensis]RDW90003.1 hypothetical protein DSM5745_01778 [Aspergillus mulundensis]
MAPGLALLLSVSSFPAGLAAHSFSHGRFHVQARTADAVVASQGVSMFPNGTLSSLGLSSACEDALYQTVDCDSAVSDLITDGYISSSGEAATTALVCAASCEASIAQLHDSVSASCGTSAELIPGMSYLDLVNQLWSNWNQSCFTDPTTGANCNDQIASWNNFTTLEEIPSADLCSYCYVKKLELMQGDAYSDTYNADWESVYEYVAAACNLTVTDFNATTSAFNASVPTTTADSCTSGDIYTANEGDTCDSIALAKGVSSATMYYINPGLVNCSDITAGTTLCLPLTCTNVYSVQTNDSCPSIAVANFITSTQLVNWNTELDAACSNLHSANPDWGSVLCVSPPGGTYTGQALNSTSDSDTPSAVSPPAGVNVAVGTTLDCGSWFVNTAALNYNCSSICLANSIAIHLFTEANPSLNYTTCDADLVTGDAYCVDPLDGWQYSNQTATNQTSTVTAATSPSAPTQTGIASNCNAYYAAQCNCASVAAEFGITLADFLAWNPAVSSDCTSGFWADEDYCVGVASNTSTTTTAITTTTSASLTLSTTITPPAATQSGIPADCIKYAVAQAGDTCATLAAKYGLTEAQFLSWNPSISADCTTGFWADEAYCVGVYVSAPAPTQTGIPITCDEYYVVQSGDTCASIAAQFSTTVVQFLEWNPAVAGDCTSGLWVGEAYCVSVYDTYV